jgi:hypothetical protein
MASGFRIEDFTLESIYTTVIKETGVEDAVKVTIGDTSAWVREGALEVVQNQGDNIKWAVDGAREIGNSTVDALNWAVLTPQKAMTKGFEIAEDTVMDIVNYIYPTISSLNSFQQMGTEMDNLIKENLFLQFFGITYSDVLCSAFCLIISLLPCEQRTKLYRDIIAFQRRAVAADAIVDSLADVATQFNVGIAGVETILQAAEGMLAGNPSDAYETQETGQSLARGIAGVQAAVENLDKIVDTINVALKFIEAGRITSPIVQYSGIWNLARNILFEMQAVAMEMAEEALMKIIKPLEDLIAKIQPSNCLNNRGGAIFNKILYTITGYKNWLVTQIGSLFTEFYSFKKMLVTFNRKSKSQLEIAMFMQSFKTLAHQFGDLAIVCGVEPCYDDDTGNTNNQIKAGRPINNPIGESSIITFDDIPGEPEENIEEIANKMKDLLPVPVQDVYVTNDTIITIYDAIENAPKKLLDMAKEINLGNNYEIAVSRETGSVKIVHTTRRFCGE